MVRVLERTKKNQIPRKEEGFYLGFIYNFYLFEPINKQTLVLTLPKELEG